MRLEIFVLGLTAFFVYNAYHDGKYTKMLYSFKKYYKMILYVCLGVGIYLTMKRNPKEGKNMLLYANNVVKLMPINKNTLGALSPIIDFTGEHDGSFMETFNGINSNPSKFSNNRIKTSGKNGNKRCVSETKKKYVAAQQGWTCSHCDAQLDHTYEIDHRIRLEYGGDNSVDNLVALCRNCHGLKTAKENM
jgi:hypothetical protein